MSIQSFTQGVIKNTWSLDFKGEAVRLHAVRYSPNHWMPAHSHSTTTVTLLLHGQFCDTVHEPVGSVQHCNSFTVAIKPAGVTLETRIGPNGAWVFVFELARQYSRKLQDTSSVPENRCLWIANGLYPRDLALLAVKVAQGDADPVSTMAFIQSIFECPLELEETSFVAAARARLEQGQSVSAVAGELGLSSSHFSRKFRVESGRTPSQCIQKVKLSRALGRLLHSDQPLALCAAELGYSDQSHFVKSLRRDTGRTPSELRALHSLF